MMFRYSLIGCDIPLQGVVPSFRLNLDFLCFISDSSTGFSGDLCATQELIRSFSHSLRLLFPSVLSYLRDVYTAVLECSAGRAGQVDSSNSLTFKAFP